MTWDLDRHLRGQGWRLASIALVPFVTWAIGSLGWRTAWILIAALQLVALLPSILLIMRRRPEDVGLLPDGAASPPARDDPAQTPAVRRHEESWTISRALRSPNFWFMGLTYGLTSGSTTTFSIHVIPFATDVGISAAAAAAAVSLLHVIALPGRIFYGWLADKVAKRLVIFGLQASLLVCFVIMSQARTETMLYLAVLTYALVIGGQMPLNQAILAELFGRTALGTIAGSVYLLGTGFNAGLPVLAGYLFDVTGNYSLAFLCLVASELLAMTALYFVRPPRAIFPVAPMAST